MRMYLSLTISILDLRTFCLRSRENDLLLRSNLYIYNDDIISA